MAELRQTPAELDALDAALINQLQHALPLQPRPFALLGQQLGCSEETVLLRLGRLLADGTLSRLGPLFQIERAGGRFVLAAMAVPEHRFAAVAALLNEMPEVAHNYRREHALNMWFVIATEHPDEVQALCERIEAASGLAVLCFPKEREYRVQLYLEARAQ